MAKIPALCLFHADAARAALSAMTAAPIVNGLLTDRNNSVLFRNTVDLSCELGWIRQQRFVYFP